MMKLGNFACEGAIFDMDGTLISSLCFWPVFWRLIGEHYFGDPDFRPDLEMDKQFRISPMDANMARFRERYGLTMSVPVLVEETRALIADFYLSEHVSLKAGVRELLDALRADGVPMVIASGSEQKDIRTVLDRFAMGDYFSATFSCADDGISKAHPDIYLRAQKHLGTRMENTFVFEDSLAALRTAKAAGFRTVGIADEQNALLGADQLAATADIYIPLGGSFLSLL